MVPTNLTVGLGLGTWWLLCYASIELGTLGIPSLYIYIYIYIYIYYIDMVPVHEVDRSPFCQVLG